MNKKVLKKTELLTYIFFFLMTFCKGLGLSNGNKIYLCVYIFGIMLVCTKYLNSTITKSELFSLAILFIIGILDMVLGNTLTILFSAICLCCVRDVNIKKIIKVMLIARVISFTIMISCTLLGVFDSPYMFHYRASIGQIKRYTFGYSHPNLAHSSFAIIVFLYGYLRGKNISFIELLTFGVINYILFVFTFSRTGFLLVLIYLFIVLFYYRFSIFPNILCKLMRYSMICFLILSILIAIGYSYSDFIRITFDNLLSGRIRYMNILINNYSIPLIGNNSYNEEVLFDNGYFSLMYEGGLLATIWFVVYCFKSHKIISNNKDYDSILFIFIFMIYCMFESYFPNILMNPSLLFLSLSVFKGGENEQYLH